MEDVHWIDPSTEELIGEIIPLIANEAVFMLITSRPNYEPPWADYSHLTRLNLSRLSRDQAVEIIKMVGGNGLSNAVINRIIVRADGNPLYVEELTRTVLDASATVNDEISEDLVPPTLQASLVARIDRLDDAKEIAQIGAILGREFSYELLAAVAEKTDTDINKALGQLVQSGMVFRRGLPPESIYTFKHSLLQDAAYATILISRRQRLHKIIVEILEDQFEAKQFENLELIAHHALQAEDWEKAFFYLQKAGLKSLDRSANREAVAFLEKALACIVHLPDSREKIASSIDIHFNLRSSLQALGEHNRVFEHLTDAETLAAELKDQKRLGWASAYLSQYLWWMSRDEDAENSGRRALTIASKIGDLTLEAVTNFFLGQGFFNIGNYPRAIENFRKNVALLHGERAYDRLGLTGLPSVLSLAWWTWSLLEQGEFAEAKKHAREAQAIAETANQPYSMATAYLAMGEMHLFEGDANSATAILQRALELCETWDLNVIYPMAAADLGLCLALDGKLGEALSLMQDGDSKKQSVQIFETPTASTALGMGYLLVSELQMAEKFALAVKEKSAERGFRGSEARALYLLGKIFAHPSISEADRASDYFLGALSLADELKMRPLSADCRYSLGSINLNIDEQLAKEFRSTAVKMYKELGLKYRNAEVITKQYRS